MALLPELELSYLLITCSGPEVLVQEMPHKKKRKRDHQQPELQWEECTQRLKRVHSSDYVQENWEHLLVIHPGDNAADAAAYAAQPELVPRHRTDIKWLDQEVAAGWSRIQVVPGKLNTFELDEGKLVVASEALPRLGVDTGRRKGQAASAISRIATNMADKGKRSIPAFAEKGGGIAQLGLRYRREEPADSGRSKLAVTATKKFKRKPDESKDDHAARQEKEDRRFYSCMNDIRDLCVSVVRATMSFMKDEVEEREVTLQSVAKDKGSVTFSYPSVQIGVGVGAGIRLDNFDKFQGTWGCLGPLTMALPEYEVLLELNDGDVLSFNSASVWHCIVRRPASMCQCVCLSLYYNSKQHKRFCEHMSGMQVVSVEDAE